MRILTDEVRGNLLAVAKKYSSRGDFELRSSGEIHDRHVFVDGRGWMIGQSVKDAARKKPTYMVEIGAGLAPSNPENLRRGSVRQRRSSRVDPMPSVMFGTAFLGPNGETFKTADFLGQGAFGEVYRAVGEASG